MTREELDITESLLRLGAPVTLGPRALGSVRWIRMDNRVIGHLHIEGHACFVQAFGIYRMANIGFVTATIKEMREALLLMIDSVRRDWA